MTLVDLTSDFEERCISGNAVEVGSSTNVFSCVLCPHVADCECSFSVILSIERQRPINTGPRKCVGELKHKQLTFNTTNTDPIKCVGELKHKQSTFNITNTGPHKCVAELKNN